MALSLLAACGRSDGPERLGESAVSVGSSLQTETGNVIFVHPDGTGLNHWTAARAYWKGPDGRLAWDALPAMAVYTGHMADALVGTSNGGATSHAFGVKVRGSGSYGRDGKGDAARAITAASGYRGSVMREAAGKGYPVGLVNDGDLAEPGTGAFLAEADDRHDHETIAAQLVFGREGRDDPAPVVILGGGERFMLPEGTPVCGKRITRDCAVHADPLTGAGPSRTDGRNLIAEAEAAGWLVIRTRDEFNRLMRTVERRTGYAPRVLGLFAADDIFNDDPEESLIAAGLVTDDRAPEDRRGRLIVWGTPPGTRGANPPTASEMARLALTILERRSREARLPFMLVVEVESPDNMANANNAIGALRALGRADQVIEDAAAFVAREPGTLLLVAADSDAAGLQLISPPPVQNDGRVTGINGNPADAVIDRRLFPVDGVEGRATAPFRASPDNQGRRADFAIAWTGERDVAGGVLARAAGLNSGMLATEFGGVLDNTGVYRLMYRTLFGGWPETTE
jgi:alkaline phosphatase